MSMLAFLIHGCSVSTIFKPTKRLSESSSDTRVSERFKEDLRVSLEVI